MEQKTGLRIAVGSATEPATRFEPGSENLNFPALWRDRGARARLPRVAETIVCATNRKRQNSQIVVWNR
jgi:hypothetical protein